MLLSAIIACNGGTRQSAASAGDSTIAYALAPMPSGQLGTMVQRGMAIMSATPDSLGAAVGNDLNCSSCHLDNGTRPNGIPLVGVYGQFPQYRSRDGRVGTIEDRINGCMRRSMNGQPLEIDSPRMKALVAALSWLSYGYEGGKRVPGQGLIKPEELRGDTVNGKQVWLAQCARCHNPDGSGSALAPPAWGPRSFNIGAGMARFRTAAGFIQYNMPFDKPGTLTHKEALDVAAWVISRPRPDLPGKEHDWPNGDAPADAAYGTVGASGNQRR